VTDEESSGVGKTDGAGVSGRRPESDRERNLVVVDRDVDILGLDVDVLGFDVDVDERRRCTLLLLLLRAGAGSSVILPNTSVRTTPRPVHSPTIATFSRLLVNRKSSRRRTTSAAYASHSHGLSNEWSERCGWLTRPCSAAPSHSPSAAAPALVRPAPNTLRRTRRPRPMRDVESVSIDSRYGGVGYEVCNLEAVDSITSGDKRRQYGGRLVEACWRHAPQPKSRQRSRGSFFISVVLSAFPQHPAEQA
jgi:hypothetical protein